MKNGIKIFNSQVWTTFILAVRKFERQLVRLKNVSFGNFRSDFRSVLIEPLFGVLLLQVTTMEQKQLNNIGDTRPHQHAHFKLFQRICMTFDAVKKKLRKKGLSTWGLQADDQFFVEK